MPTAEPDFPDPLDDRRPATGQSPDDLLSRMADEAIDQLIAEADAQLGAVGNASPANKSDAQETSRPPGPSNAMSPSPVSTERAPAPATSAALKPVPAPMEMERASRSEPDASAAEVAAGDGPAADARAADAADVAGASFHSVLSAADRTPAALDVNDPALAAAEVPATLPSNAADPRSTAGIDSGAAAPVAAPVSEPVSVAASAANGSARVDPSPASEVSSPPASSAVLRTHTDSLPEIDPPTTSADVKALLAEDKLSSSDEKSSILLLPLQVLSAPLTHADDRIRNAVGQVAILTLLNAIAVIIYVTIVRRH